MSLRYGVAVAAVGAAALLHLLIDPLIVQQTPFLLVFAAVMVSAWYGGLGPGVFATALAALVADYFFLYPLGSFSGFSLEGLPLGVFVLEGILVSLLVEALRGAKRRAETSAWENTRLYQELAERERRLHELLGQILVAEEEERHRIAYEVHDGLTQMVVAIHQRLEILTENHPPGSARGRKELEEAVDLAQRTVDEARRIIADLRPPALDDLGLSAAIRQQVEDLRLNGYAASYEEVLDGERLPAVVEAALFRVVQEALTNVRKHSKTERTHVTLVRRDEVVWLEVRDWGVGFDPTEVKGGGGPGERIGLSSMRERIASLGGGLTIRSEPEAGTSVTVELPLPPIGEGAGHGK